MIGMTTEGRLHHRFTPTPNGVLRLELGLAGAGKVLDITGGPFDAMPYTTCDAGVCVRAERVPRHADVVVPIEDFEVPDDETVLRSGLLRAFELAIDGRRVYVGCAGGFGRTGLFLALMAKVAGVAEPVRYVRETYTPRAVETREQEEFVENFDVSNLTTQVRQYARRAFVKSWVGFILSCFRFPH